MTKPTITTRATKGSALTWTEGDTNLENLRDATIAIKAGTGGTDVVSDLNGTVTLVAGTNISLSGDNTAKTVTINNTASAGIANVVEDLSPQLGGDLDVNGNKIVSVSNGNIALEPNGTGKVTATSNIETTGDVKAFQLFSTQSSGDEGGEIKLAKPATGTTIGGTGVNIDVYQNKLRIWEDGGSNRGAYIDLTAAGASVGTNLLSGGGGISDVVADTSPQLGGDLDVNGKNITSASNGNINITPNGSGNISLAPATGKIILGSVDWPTTGGTNGQVLTTNGTGTASWTTISSGGIGNVVEDTSPQLGGALDVNGQQITSASNGNIAIVPNGSGNIQLTPSTGKITLGSVDWPTTGGTNGQVLTTNGTGTASWTTISSGATDLNGLSDVVITAAATNDVLVFDGTNWVDTAASTLTVSAASTATTATGATNINISTTTGNTNDSTLYPVFVAAASTGNQLPHIDSAAVTWSGSTHTLALAASNGSPASLTLGSDGGGTLTLIPSTSQSTNYSITFPSAVGANGSLLQGNGSGQLSWSQALNSVTIGATTATTGRFTTTSVTAANDLRLYNSANTFYVGFKAGTVAANKIWTLPSADGTANQVLKTDGAGVLGWATASSGGSPIIAFSHNNTGTVISGNIKRMTIAEYVDTGALISITGDQFTLAAGTYLITNPVYPNLTSATTAIQFWNVTDSVQTYRATVDNPFGSSSIWGAPGTGHFTLAATKTFELRITTTLTSGSLPVPYSFTGSGGAGNYLDWVITKVA